MTDDEFSDLIGRIYDGALDPAGWPGTLERIAGAVGAAVGFVVLHDFRNNLGGRFFEHGLEAPWGQIYVERYASVNPVVPVVETRDVGAVDTLATMFHDDRWEVSAFNREWIRALGLRDVLGMLVLRTGRRGAWLGMLRREELGDFGPDAVALFRRLSPHVCRAMRISDALDLRSVASDRLAETLDALATPVFLLDADARVVHRNEAAERQAEAGQVLRVAHGRLQAVHRASDAALAEAVRRALAGGLDGPPAPHAVPLGGATAARRAIASVLPLRGRRGVADGAAVIRPYAAAAAVFVQDPAEASAIPGAALAELYGLTPAELRFLGALAPGRTVSEASAALGIGAVTGRTHLNRIFGKTGTARQAELAQLLAASTAPVRGGA